MRCGARQIDMCYALRMDHDGQVMDTVLVSPRFQVVIPRRIRESLGLRPGQKMQALQYDGRIELTPLVPLASARGLLTGLATDLDSERDRD